MNGLKLFFMRQNQMISKTIPSICNSYYESTFFLTVTIFVTLRGKLSDKAM